jgi:transcriptional regulator with XRE-family HTH domain
VSVGIGTNLRRIRQQWQLSLREVEERSLRFAQEQGQSYHSSASWLARLEREDQELTVNKLIALADVYGIPAEQMLAYTGDPQPVLRQLSSPNATILLAGGSLEEQARYVIPDAPTPEPPIETALLPPDNGLLVAPYRRGIIGKRDRTLDPMNPPVQLLISILESALSPCANPGPMILSGPSIFS